MRWQIRNDLGKYLIKPAHNLATRSGHSVGVLHGYCSRRSDDNRKTWILSLKPTSLTNSLSLHGRSGPHFKRYQQMRPYKTYKYMYVKEVIQIRSWFSLGLRLQYKGHGETTRVCRTQQKRRQILIRYCHLCHTVLLLPHSLYSNPRLLVLNPLNSSTKIARVPHAAGYQTRSVYVWKLRLWIRWSW